MASPIILSHWHHPFEDLQYSSQEFYNSVAKRIKDQQFPAVTLQNKEFLESSVFSAKRTYLRIMRYDLCFDICAAPFGTSFFVSWRLTELEGCEIAAVKWIPFIGKAWARLLMTKTYFQRDNEIMFRESIHSLLLKSLDELTATNGIRQLNEHERAVSYIKPIDSYE